MLTETPPTFSHPHGLSCYIAISVNQTNSSSPPTQTPRRQSRLFCRYHDNNRNPMYLLQPVKQEDEWDRPYIVRYHDIISHDEIEKVKELAKPRVSLRCLSLYGGYYR